MIDNIYTTGIRSGWDVKNASQLTQDLTLEADVAIVGTGAGGGTAAEILSQAGLKVVMLEEGLLQTSDDFKDMDEARAYRDLYQESAGRVTSDGAIAVLQGRSVGGSTTINWTSSFRTPDNTLNHWTDKHGVKGVSPDEMTPWFDHMEKRLHVQPWDKLPNANNSVLGRGCEALGWEVHVIPRNVVGCWDSGYCGLGCPVNAKQSMLVTTIPSALKNGATLVHNLRVQEVKHQNGKVTGLLGVALDSKAVNPTGIKVHVKAKHYVLSGGAINTPALMQRSNLPDPHKQSGKHTCIHPVNLIVAQFPELINGFYGAPQSLASNEFLWPSNENELPGYKIEVPPMHPALGSTVLGVHGNMLKDAVNNLPYLNAVLTLFRDGFSEQSPGGQVRVDDQGFAILDYDISDYLWSGFKHSYHRMAELQFAAGAKRIMPSHLDGEWVTSLKAAKEQIDNLAYEKFRLSIFTAHLMGGSAMGEDPAHSVTNSVGQHHQLDNLSVMDGSLFPTSVGVNPQLSVYALVAKNATALAEKLKG